MKILIWTLLRSEATGQAGEMKILIWIGHHDPLDAAIKFLTHGRGTHAAFLRADGATVHEAFWPRVRDRALTDEDRKNARAFELEGMSLRTATGRRQVLAFEHLFDANLRRGIRYSVLDLMRYALNIPSRGEIHTFCSRYVLHCCHAILHECQMPLVRIPDGDWASPRDLLISPQLIPSDFSREDHEVCEGKLFLLPSRPLRPSREASL